jgi:hypothetical protein
VIYEAILKDLSMWLFHIEAWKIGITLINKTTKPVNNFKPLSHISCNYVSDKLHTISTKCIFALAQASIIHGNRYKTIDIFLKDVQYTKQ